MLVLALKFYILVVHTVCLRYVYKAHIRFKRNETAYG